MAMTRTRVALLFSASALVSGAITIAPQAKSNWRLTHPALCAVYHYAYGFQGQRDDFSTDIFGVSYTGSPNLFGGGYLICPDLTDSVVWGGPYTPYIRARFSRAENGQNPLLQTCTNTGSYGACSAYYTTATTPPPYSSFFMDIEMTPSSGYWSYAGLNTVQLQFLPTSQDWGQMLWFQGLTIGSEYGPPSGGSSGPY